MNVRENGNHEREANRNPAIVVGVDGSAGAREALRWALAEGRLRNAPVRVVHAWTFGYIGAGVDGYGAWGGALGAYTSLGIDLNDLHRAAEDLLERAIADVGEESDGVQIERLVVQGTPAEVLVHAAAPSDLLVVGSRGHGGFVGLLLGSVSQQCVHHARSPVVVVHAKPTAAGHEAAAGAEAASPQSPDRSEDMSRAAIERVPGASA
jgi:nucleotide-binding universal stress UspA family protein